MHDGVREGGLFGSDVGRGEENFRGAEAFVGEGHGDFGGGGVGGQEGLFALFEGGGGSRFVGAREAAEEADAVGEDVIDFEGGILFSFEEGKIVVGFYCIVVVIVFDGRYGSLTIAFDVALPRPLEIAFEIVTHKKHVFLDVVDDFVVLMEIKVADRDDFL